MARPTYTITEGYTFPFVTSKDRFRQFMKRFRKKIARVPVEVYRHLFALQRDAEHAAIELTGKAGTITIILSKEDFYLKGYRKAGKWYFFSDFQAPNNAANLPFSSSYTAPDGVQANSRTEKKALVLSRLTLEAAIKHLVDIDPITANSEERSLLAESLMILIQMFCEGARFEIMLKYMEENYFKNEEALGIDRCFIQNEWTKISDYLRYTPAKSDGSSFWLDRLETKIPYSRLELA